MEWHVFILDASKVVAKFAAELVDSFEIAQIGALIMITRCRAVIHWSTFGSSITKAKSRKKAIGMYSRFVR